jgi:hypothetical protein
MPITRDNLPGDAAALKRLDDALAISSAAADRHSARSLPAPLRRFRPQFAATAAAAI